MTINSLLEYIKLTNPEMDKKKLMKELMEIPYSTACLALIAGEYMKK